MTLIDDMAKRIYERVYTDGDGRGWENETTIVRTLFLDYARAAQGALVDCEDFDQVLPLLNPVVLAEATRRARGA